MSSGGEPDDTPPRPKPQPIQRPKGAGKGDGAGSPPPDPCNIVENTIVNSPDRTVLRTVRVNDVLSVRLSPGPPIQLLVETSAGAVLGSLTSASVPQLVNCIGSGFSYSAIVTSIQGGVCNVQIQPT
jgi:hypothetical protein